MSPFSDRPELAIFGIIGCLVVAIANGANDIANSVGTSYGAGALTLRQAILFGASAEFAGAISLGSFVAKTIAKGVIEPASFAADGCHGVLMFGVGMLSVLAGTGSTTLLATLYGLPISASHGVIGGLVAVGVAAHGAGSLGIAPLEATLVAWVASPLLGCVTSGLLHVLIAVAVHETANPPRRAHALQPVLVAATVTIAAAFLVVAGPAALRIQPLSLAVSASAGLGVFVALVASCISARGTAEAAASAAARRAAEGRRAHFQLEELACSSASTSSTRLEPVLNTAGAGDAGSSPGDRIGVPLWGPGASGAAHTDSEGGDSEPEAPSSQAAGPLGLLQLFGGLLCGADVQPRRERDLILRARDGGSSCGHHVVDDKAAGGSADVEGGGRANDSGGGDGGGGGSGGSGGAEGEGDGQFAAEERPFIPLLILSALTVAFAHGGNDLGNSIGPLAALLVAIAWPAGDIAAIPEIPVWVLMLGASGFVLGILLLGERTITTVGSKITKLTPSRSFAVQMGTAIAVLSSTVLGLAVSTSHCLVGSIIGVGLAARLRASRDAELNVAMLTKIVIGWAATIPLAMVVSVAIFEGMLPFYKHDPICRAQHHG